MIENNSKILVVEDNEDNQKLVHKVLSFYGYETQIVASGEEAILWCNNNVADMILMDISLPVKDGLQTTKEIRQIKNYENVPIIALTAHAMLGWEQKCLEAGCTGYITKPFRPQNLVSELQKY